MIEQGIELVDERLHFRGIRAADAAITAVPDRRERGAQTVEGRQAAAHMRQAGDQAADCEDEEQRAVSDEHDLWDVVEDHAEHDVGRRDQPEGPEERAEHDPRAKGARHQASMSTR